MVEGERMNDPHLGTEDDARFILSSQQNRAHHLQSLAQGLLGVAIAIITIVATISLALFDGIPEPPSNPEYYSGIADSTIIAGPLTVQWTTAISQLIGLTLFLVSGNFLITAIFHLYNVFTSNELDLGIPLEKKRIIGPDPVPITIQDCSDSPSITGEYQKAIQENQEHLHSLHRSFIAGSLRLFVFPIILVNSMYIYHWAVTVKPEPLLVMSLVMIVPATIVSPIFQRFISSNNSQRNPSNPSVEFAQEMLRGKGRWEEITATSVERILSQLLSTLALLILIPWLVLLFIHLLGV